MMDTIKCPYCGREFENKGDERSLARRHETECFAVLPEYEKGYISGVRAFAVWKDGTETVGVMQTPFKQYVAEWLAERRKR